jgi:pyridoxamine 5'-phosphate oxidase
MSAPETTPLREDLVPATPFPLFTQWFEAAAALQLPEPAAMTLATVSADGGPAARVVLLRGQDERGFVFYTNYDSRKGADLAADPRAALAFHWAPLQRQVRVEGRAEPVSAEESDAYFRSRPHGHRLGAHVSPQSQVIPSRHFLEERLAAVARQYPDDVPRPPHWGGYRVVPHRVEFWQGRENRLHDRLVYRLTANGAWTLERLAP